MARLLMIILLLMLLVLQYRLWVGEGSLAEVSNLRHEIERHQLELETLRKRNAELQAEVQDLKRGVDAIEERARSELGMIRQGETFYQIIEPPRQEKQ